MMGVTTPTMTTTTIMTTTSGAGEIIPMPLEAGSPPTVSRTPETSFYHWRLRDLLLRHYGFGMYSIQYECIYYYHPRHEQYWTASIRIGRPSPYLQAL